MLGVSEAVWLEPKELRGERRVVGHVGLTGSNKKSTCQASSTGFKITVAIIIADIVCLSAMCCRALGVIQPPGNTVLPPFYR